MTNSHQSKGGHARAAVLSPEARSEIARRGANARWGGEREPQPLNGAQLRAIIAKIKRHSEAIAKHRDQLREIYSDLESIVESADDGLHSLEYAIERLSEHL